jgi:hypothetical protein
MLVALGAVTGDTIFWQVQNNSRGFFVNYRCFTIFTGNFPLVLAGISGLLGLVISMFTVNILGRKRNVVIGVTGQGLMAAL